MCQTKNEPDEVLKSTLVVEDVTFKNGHALQL